MRKAINGCILKPAADPTPIVERPWNSLVVSFEQPLAGQVNTTNNIEAQLSLQLFGVTTPQGVVYEIQIEDVRVWGAVSGTDEIKVDFFDLTSADSTVLRSLSDYPGTNRRAVVGYRWPESQQRRAFTAPSASPVPVFETSNGVNVSYVHLRWRIKPAPPAP